MKEVVEVLEQVESMGKEKPKVQKQKPEPHLIDTSNAEKSSHHMVQATMDLEPDLEDDRYNWKVKGRRRDQVPEKFKRREIVDHVVKQALAACGDSSSESDMPEGPEDASMMVVEDRDSP
ncbi:hypothetical protein HAX54_019634 [Datura stramonium]|uniref:Uncharacterized protein n=1 Tax=Datura stramonium TaxID=4076 RepID=A0ABS8UR62_DATST|nr:hypothetical protein [Datura stramonium]